MTKEKQDELRKCPVCGKMFTRHEAALSRRDNKTYICPECGTREAMEDAGIDIKEQEKVLKEIYQ